MIRQPISISHEKHHYQVIFRAPAPRINNWNLYVDAETKEDASNAARNLIAADSLHNAEVQDWMRWKIVEVNQLT